MSDSNISSDQICSAQSIAIDPYRALVFPNAIRARRRGQGEETLLMLAGRLPQIPYIRLSKIERGEVVAKAHELRLIAAALAIDPQALLIDVTSPDHDIARWARARGEALVTNREGEELAMLLAAAFRARRATDPALTLAALQADHGLPAVTVSRIENAARTPDRWNPATMAAICRLLGVANAGELVGMLRADHGRGWLDRWLAVIPGAEQREIRTGATIERLRAELRERGRSAPARRTDGAMPGVRDGAGPRSLMAPGLALRRMTVRGAPLADGLVDPTAPDGEVVAPAGTGPRAYALRMCRPTLGGAIPGNAVLIVDPDRYPVGAGLAVLTEGKALRVVVITTDIDGRSFGHSVNPDLRIALDDRAPRDVATVTAILLG